MSFKPTELTHPTHAHWQSEFEEVKFEDASWPAAGPTTHQQGVRTRLSCIMSMHMCKQSELRI